MRYLFDDYVLDTQRYELHRAGTPIHLRPKVFQVLAYLLAHRDRVVPKAELLAELWSDVRVTDGSIQRARLTRGELPLQVAQAHAARAGLSLCGGCRGAGARHGG